MLQQSGTLPIGVVVDGVVHKEFLLRTSTVQDNIDVTDELVDAGEAPTQLRVATSIMARQIEALGTLKREQITTQLVRSMSPSDWNELDVQSQALEKKLRRDGPLLPPTGGSPVAQPSSAEASTQTE